MKCDPIRNRILAVEEPAALPPELAAHLAGCESCRVWAQRFVKVDRALNQLPVPASTGVGKKVVLERVRNARPAKPIPSSTKTSGNHKPLPMPVDLEKDLPKKRFKPGAFAAKYWPAGVIAATLLIGVIAWMSVRNQKQQQPNTPPSDPLLDSVVQLNVELARSQSPVERVDVLTRLADELNKEMRDIARADSTGENMQALEVMYRKVVLQALIGQAKEVERSKREAVLRPVIEKLGQAVHSANQSAAESPEQSAIRLRNVAEIARDGAREIDKIIKGASL